MFGKKKEPKRQSRSGNLAQYGIFEIPESLDDLGGAGEDEDDEDLEAELAALTSGGNTTVKQKHKAVQRIDSSDLSAMVSESIKDIDEDISDGEDDPDLLEELNMITENEPALSDQETNQEAKNSENSPTNENDGSVGNDRLKLLQERLKLYQKAEKKAKQDNEAGKARRFGRGIKTLQQLLKDVQTGAVINEADIPPPLPPSATSEITERPTDDGALSELTEENPSPPSLERDNDSEPSPAAPVVQVDQEALDLLNKRQQEYKIAALAWKKAGNMQEAMQYVKVAKQFDIVIAAINAGEAIDLSDMPPTPTGPSISTSVPPASPSIEKEDVEVQQHAEPDTPAQNKMEEVVTEQRHGIEDIESALKERLDVYKRTKAIAENEGNSSKVRRYGRICKQFEEAIKLYARGKPVSLDELPVPPGFSPLSTGIRSSVSEGPKEDEKSKPESNSEGTSGTNVPSPPPRTNIGVNKSQKHATRADKQMIMLQQRQYELKEAALKAKNDGDLDLARDYLRQAKGIQPLIQASIAGLPVDMNSIPLSPVAKMELSAHGLTGQTDENFQLIHSEDCLEESGGSDEQIYDNLENQLIKQIKWCLSTRDHSKQLGDVPGYNRWERLALGYTRDLDMLRVRRRDSLPPPLHHYETKTYAIVQSCTDLNDSDIEISIIRGINYPRDADTYVMFEFPYPSDSPPADRTSTVKGTCNPEYEATFPLTGILDRNSRQCQRAFKRHALKCQVWAKGGFFRSDSLLGTVTVKLQSLEMQCILHDSFPLMEGRKPTGGKLELKIRLRNPILTKQIEQITDKWLIIDN
ncbi:coiled-coil and C2 domain-containing protein 1-like isoform X3 [Vespula squamosa]|uniref:Coiled-coil and C2 domain-containing protein 1-like isoform X3 n=1 Tax=Vespula squamosa TaxID=30214 RepID=A0ABD1ZYP4_VESSQ